MSVYVVRFPDYTLMHTNSYTYFDYFELNGKKYSIGSHVKLNDEGMGEMYHNGKYYYKKGDFRLVDSYINDRGEHKWLYIIGWTDAGSMVTYSTKHPPEKFVSEVLSLPINETATIPGELRVEIKKPNYTPSDWEVGGAMLGWAVFIIVMIGASIFKDWWLALGVRIFAGFYFGNWRDRKLSEAVRTQKFKE